MCETDTLVAVCGDTIPGGLLRDVILPSSFLRHSFSMEVNIGDRVFYTRSNGVRVPATVVGMAEDGVLHLEYHQDGVRVVNRQCKMDSMSFAIPSPHSPPPSLPRDATPSVPPGTQTSAPLEEEVPLKSPSRSPTPPASPPVLNSAAEDQQNDNTEALPAVQVPLGKRATQYSSRARASDKARRQAAKEVAINLTAE